MKLLKNEHQLSIAANLAAQAHKGQLDKGGNPYFDHLLRVSNLCKTHDSKVVGFLHDITEDGHMTIGQLRTMGFLSRRQIEAILIMDKSYSDYQLDTYYTRIKFNLIAREVKLADIEDNMDLSRLKEVSDKDMERFKRYKKWKSFLINT